MNDSLDSGWKHNTARALLHVLTPILKRARDVHVNHDGAAPFSYEEARPVLIDALLHRGCNHREDKNGHYCAMEVTEGNTPNSIVWHTQYARRNKYQGCAVVVKLSHEHHLPEGPPAFSVNAIGHMKPSCECKRTSNLSFWQVVFGNSVKKEWLGGSTPQKGGLNVGAVILDAAILACERKMNPLSMRVASDLTATTVQHLLENGTTIPFDLRPFYHDKRAWKNALTNRVRSVKSRVDVAQWVLRFDWAPGEGSSSSNEINNAFLASDSMIECSAIAICHGMTTTLYNRLLNWRKRYISWCEAVENLDGPSFNRWTLVKLMDELRTSLEQHPDLVMGNFDITPLSD